MPYCMSFLIVLVFKEIGMEILNKIHIKSLTFLHKSASVRVLYVYSVIGGHSMCHMDSLLPHAVTLSVQLHGRGKHEEVT